MDNNHPDFKTLDHIRRVIYQLAGGSDLLASSFPILVRDAVDFVIDPVRTARTRIVDLDNVEKTFVGLKIEHYFRDLLNVPKGLRDLVIDGTDVDIKNTVGATWMIPPETYRNEDPCVLIATAEAEGYCRLGLMVARNSYLTKPNRDKKRSVSAAGRNNIMWLLDRGGFPRSRWDGLDMARFRDLRKVRGGTNRAAIFFEENLGRTIHRSIVQALLFDQHDYMKRLRGNGGARDLLGPKGITLLSGAYDAAAAKEAGIVLAADEFVSVQS